MLSMVYSYVKARYLSEKGQGMVEYGLLLAFAVAIGVAVYGTGQGGPLENSLKAIVEKVGKGLRGEAL